MVPARGEDLTHSVPGILLFVYSIKKIKKNKNKTALKNYSFHTLTQCHKEKRLMSPYSDKALGSVLPTLIKRKSNFPNI
jgi:hypothetical protein